ncbi:YdcF family protein [Candidatus Microgenomates bacterium]|nr:YdcF family protein [Candidatus Microgenomates bacterium]
MLLRVLLLAVLVLLFIGSLIGIGFYISPQDDLKPSDVIVAISGGDTAARAIEAVRLYQEGWAPLLIFAGAAKDPRSPSNASVMGDIAVAQGVPPDVIALDETSTTTRQNAQEVSNIVQAFKQRRIILVTSPYHQRRAAIEFQDRLGEDIDIINHSAVDQTWSRKAWFLSPLGWYYTLTEIPKTSFTLISHWLTNL